MSRYVCREHPTQAVTWRGSGCRACAAEARGAAKRKQKVRPSQDDLAALLAVWDAS